MSNLLSIDLDRKLSASINVINSILSEPKQEGGLASGDNYHKGKLSILKTSQLLWAISAASTHSRTNQNREDLRSFLILAIADPKFTKYWGRTLNVVFSLLALTSESENVYSSEYLCLVNKLLELKNSDDAWGFQKASKSSVRATSMVCFALTRVFQHAGISATPYDSLPLTISKACTWLLRVSSPNGNWGKSTRFSTDIFNSSQFEPGIAVTSWAIYAICESLLAGIPLNIEESLASRLEMGMKWLISIDQEIIATQPEIEQEIYHADSNLYHNYEELGLEITILAALSYNNCVLKKIRPFLQVRPVIYEWTARLLRNERNGYWFDKNCGDYNHLWSIAHAVYTLSEVKSYMISEQRADAMFKIKLFRSIFGYLKKIFSSKAVVTLLICGFLIVATPFLVATIGDNTMTKYQNYFTAFGLMIAILGIYLTIKSPES